MISNITILALTHLRIDITDSTFETLNAEAVSTGTNLKNYIENMLDYEARYLEESETCNYRFSCSEEPSDKELSIIMANPAEMGGDSGEKGFRGDAYLNSDKYFT